MDFPLIIAVIYFSALGSGPGALSGISLGIHVNALALLLCTFYPSIEALFLPYVVNLGVDASALPLLISSMIMSAAVVHSFIDFVPSVFLGAPDEDSVMSMLPGHHMLLSGRGMEAVMCAAEGSLIGALISITLYIPLSWVLFLLRLESGEFI